MNKIVINSGYGGYGLSEKAIEMLGKLKGVLYDRYFDWYAIPRHDKDLVNVVETMGDEASGSHARLRIVEIEPLLYRITEYDGFESIEVPESINWVVINNESNT